MEFAYELGNELRHQQAFLQTGHHTPFDDCAADRSAIVQVPRLT
jgi:hypothetical protein